MITLERDFDSAMISIYERAKREAGYNATIFLRMLHDKRGLRTAKQLINGTKPSDGYTALWERGRLDLTVEALIIDDQKWWPLFATEEIERARKRLAEYHYVTPIERNK